MEYGLTTAYGSAVTNGNLVQQHQLSLSGLSASLVYHYRVRSSDQAGNTATSADFTFQTLAGTVFTAQPQTRTNTAGSSATFNASATGTPPLSYQWLFNGVSLANGSRINGATSNTLTISYVQWTDAGNYALVVSNTAGSVTSSVATLTVVNLPGNCLPPPSGLVGWWPGEGNANDIAGTNNGTLQGGASAGAAGVVGAAFSVNGTSSYVQIPDSPSLHPTNFTIETWVRFDALIHPGRAARLRAISTLSSSKTLAPTTLKGSI